MTQETKQKLETWYAPLTTKQIKAQIRKYTTPEDYAEAESALAQRCNVHISPAVILEYLETLA